MLIWRSRAVPLRWGCFSICVRTYCILKHKNFNIRFESFFFHYKIFHNLSFVVWIISMREIKNLKRNSNIPTQSYASNPYGYNPDRNFHQNYRPNNNSFRSRGSPNQTTLNNARHNYPKNPRPTPFRPQRRGNYP